MRHLQDIIQEGLLDVEKNDKNVDDVMRSELRSIWYDKITKSKSMKEFNKVCMELKKSLDKSFGKQYDKVTKKMPMNGTGRYLSIIHEGNLDRWLISVNYGEDKSVSLCWFNSSNVVGRETGSGLYYIVNGYCKSIMTVEQCYTYELNQDWNELRKYIFKGIRP